MGEFTDFVAYRPGDWLSLVGLVLTIVGFIATLWNLLRAKNAAKRAEDAVTKVRDDMRRTDMVADFAAAVAAMEEIKRLHREAAWPVLPDRYAELRKSLISIKSANKRLPDYQQSALQSAIQHFSSLERTVETALDTKEPLPNTARLNSLVSKRIDALQGVLVEVRNGIGE